MSAGSIEILAVISAPFLVAAVGFVFLATFDLLDLILPKSDRVYALRSLWETVRRIKK